MSLESTLTGNDFDGLTAEQALSALLADVPGSGDRQLWRWSGVMSHLKSLGFTNEQTDALKANIGTVTGGLTLDASLSSSGVDFGNPEYRAELAQSAVGDFKPVVNAILLIGQPLPRWKVEGLTIAPTLDEVTAAIARNTVSAWWAQVRDETVPAMLTAGNTIDQIKSAIAGV